MRTIEAHSLNRRDFLKTTGALVAGTMAVAGIAGCATEATGTLPSTTPNEFWLPEAWDEEHDIVVVGFGAAGVSAGIAGMKAGADTVVLEVAPKELRGGNSGVCGGGWICPTDVQGYADFLYRLNLQRDDKQELLEFSQTLSGMVDWIEELGIDYMDTKRAGFNFYPKEFHEMAPTMNNSLKGVSETGMEHHAMADADGNQAMGGKYFYEPMAEIYEGMGGTVLYETRGRELVQNPQTKEVLGVRAEKADGSSIFIKARKGVVLACGGYEASPELTQEYIRACMDIAVTGSPFNRGDGVLMAQAAGARLHHMDCIEWQGYGARIEPDSEVNGRVGTSTNWHSEPAVIMVNKYGRRFFREDMRMGHTRQFPGVEFLGFADSTDTINDWAGAPAYVIFDQTRFAEGAGNFYGGKDKLAMGWFGQHELYQWSDDNFQELASGIIKKGETLEELAEAFGFVGVAEFAEEVARYNGFVDAGRDEDFGRDPEKMVKIETGPFYGIEVWPSLLNTQGGPKRSNATCRVVDYEGNEIPRLYSAGELGSQFGLVYHGSGNTTEAVMTGKVAAENAATLEPWDAA